MISLRPEVVSRRRAKAAPAVVLALAAACSSGGGSTAGPQAGAGGGGGPGGAGAGPRGPAAFAVETAAAEARSVEFTVHATGSVEAFERVQITARVAGAVETVRFKDGALVKEGQVLAEIEPRRYQVALAAARAGLQKAEAAVAEARAGLERRDSVAKTSPGVIPEEELDTFRTRVRSAEAEIASMQAQVDRAALDLREAYVRAPLAGVIETRTVQTGQYLQPGAVLATIVRRDPLLLRFQVPEPESVGIRVGGEARFRVPGVETDQPARITHVSQAASEAGRFITVTAEVAPEARDLLRPGAFAEVVVPVGSTREVTVIPQTAIRPSERGFLSYVVEGDTAKERILTLGMRTADGRVEVRSGLRAGELVVVRGAEALRDGVKVRRAGSRPAEAGPPAGGAAPVTPSGATKAAAP